MSYVTVVVSDKSTKQVLDEDSGLGTPDEDRIHVEFTAAFSEGDLVWVSDDNSPGEFGTIQTIFLNDYLKMTANLAALYEVAENAKVFIINDISNDVIDADTWRNRLTGVGTCKLRLSNLNNKYEGLFAPDDPIIVSIVGTIMWVGFVDDVRPYLPEKGVLTNESVITGRDFGRYLVDLSFTKSYKKQQAGVIIDDIMTILGDPLIYTDPTGTPEIKYEGVRAKLGDALREICERCSPGYDFYIDNVGELHFIVATSVDSGVDLDIVADDPTNNLLTFQEYEQVGTSIKNRIEIHAGSVRDHYSDGNQDDFSTDGAAAVADSDTHIYGIQSIELTFTDPGRVFLEFDQNPVLADYGYSGSVDLSKLCEAKVMIRGLRTGKIRFSLRPFLVDGDDNKIVFCRVGPDATIGGKGGSKGWTDHIVTWDHRAFWTQLSYPLGAHDSNPIKPGPGLMTGFWNADDGDITFDWTDIVDMGFEYPFDENAVILIDGWCIPSLEAKSIQNDAASQDPVTGYGLRMHSEFRKEMRSQKQLIVYAKRLLILRKDPLQKFKGVAKGQVGTKYAAQSVDVNVPAYGLTDEPYTITALHHKLHHGRGVRGWDFLTEYELVAQDAPAYMVIRDDHPMETSLDRLARENRGFKGGMEEDDSLIGDVQSGRFVQETKGAYFPIYPADGDLHWLTADFDDTVYTGFQYYGAAVGILYTYDETSSKWVRGPKYLGRRAANPPAGSGGGEYVGDTYFNTTSGTSHQWDGAAWSQISSLNLADAPDFGTVEWPTDQLAIEMRPWTGNFSIIWDDKDDEPPTDWNHFKWGLRDQENVADATISYASGLPATVDVNFGQNLNLGDGEWFAYWDENFITGGDYDVQWTQVYSNASGVGKGLLAVVQVRNAASESPSIMLYNTYIPQMGVGSLVAHSIYSKHISGDWITGKYFRTGPGVQWAAGAGTQGIMFQALGIMGKDGAGDVQFFLDTADGKAYFLGGKAYLDEDGINIKHDGIATTTGVRFRNNVGAQIGQLILDIGNGISLMGSANTYLGNVAATAYFGVIINKLWLQSASDIELHPTTFTESFGDILPDTDSSHKLGEDSTPKRWLEIHGDKVYGAVYM